MWLRYLCLRSAYLFFPHSLHDIPRSCDLARVPRLVSLYVYTLGICRSQCVELELETSIKYIVFLSLYIDCDSNFFEKIYRRIRNVYKLTVYNWCKTNPKISSDGRWALAPTGQLQALHLPTWAPRFIFDTLTVAYLGGRRRMCSHFIINGLHNSFFFFFFAFQNSQTLVSILDRLI